MHGQGEIKCNNGQISISYYYIIVCTMMHYIDAEGRADDGRNETTEGVAGDRDGPAILSVVTIIILLVQVCSVVVSVGEEFLYVSNNGLIRSQLQLEQTCNESRYALSATLPPRPASPHDNRHMQSTKHIHLPAQDWPGNNSPECRSSVSARRFLPRDVGTRKRG